MMPHLDIKLDSGSQVYTRDFREQIAPNETQRATLIVAGCYILVIGILW